MPKQKRSKMVNASMAALKVRRGSSAASSQEALSHMKRFRSTNNEQRVTSTQFLRTGRTDKPRGRKRGKHVCVSARAVR